MSAFFRGGATAALVAAMFFVGGRIALAGERSLRRQGVPGEESLGRLDVKYSRWATIAFACIAVACFVAGLIAAAAELL